MPDDLLWLAEASEARRRRRHRLHDIRVGEVSVVDRAANRRKWLVVKREGDMADQLGDEVEVDADGTATAVFDEDEPVEVVTLSKDDDTVDDFGRDPADVSPERKQQAIPSPVKDAVSKIVRSAVERLMSIAQALRGAKTTDAKTPTPLPASIGRGLRAVAAELQGATQRYPSPTAKAQHEKCPEGQVFDPEKKACVPMGKGSDPAIAKQRLSMPGPVKKAVLGRLAGFVERAMSLRNDVRIAKDATGETETPLPATVGRALRALATELGTTLSRFPSPTAKGFAALPLEVDAESLVTPVEKALTIPGPVKRAVARRLTAVIELAMSVRNAVRGARETTERSRTPLPPAVGRWLKGLATQLGAIAQRYPSPTAKGLELVEIDDDVAVEKAADELSLHPEASADLGERVEKALDDLTNALLMVEEYPERDPDDADDVSPPSDIATALNEASLDVLGIGRDYADEWPSWEAPSGEEDDVADETSADTTGDEEGEAGSDADGGADDGDVQKVGAKPDEEPDEEEPDAKPKPKPKAKPKAKAKPNPGLTAADVQKAITAGVSKAIQPCVDRIDDLESQLREQGVLIEKMANVTPDTNAREPGRGTVQKRDDGFEGGLGLLSAEEVKELEKEDLLF